MNTRMHASGDLERREFTEETRAGCCQVSVWASTVDASEIGRQDQTTGQGVETAFGLT